MIWSFSTLAIFLLLAMHSVVKSQQVSTNVYDDLVFYFKYASSAYALLCLRPNGNAFIGGFMNLLTGAQGFIARDDARREIVVTFRGSFSIADILTDIHLSLTPFDSPGAAAPWGTRVHSGFLAGWNSVSTEVLHSVRQELRKYPEYSLVTSGHSLGGALASLAAMTFKANFPSSNVTMYTYGQPRTGNTIYADWVNSELGANVFRVVHTSDGIPTIIPAGSFPVLLNNQAPSVDLRKYVFGYRHHGIEYWQNPDPASGNTTWRCDPNGEDSRCSASLPSTGFNLAHMAYFGILAITPFCYGGS